MTGTRDLVVEKRLGCRADAVFRCWTTPELLRRFLPARPELVIEASVDPQPGGLFLLRSQPGEPSIEGCVLHMIPGRRLVWSDTLGAGWHPTGRGGLTADLSFSPTDRGFCDYRAILKLADPTQAEALRADWERSTTELGRLAAGLGP